MRQGSLAGGIFVAGELVGNVVDDVARAAQGAVGLKLDVHGPEGVGGITSAADGFGHVLRELLDAGGQTFVADIRQAAGVLQLGEVFDGFAGALGELGEGVGGVYGGLHHAGDGADGKGAGEPCESGADDARGAREGTLHARGAAFGDAGGFTEVALDVGELGDQVN